MLYHLMHHGLYKAFTSIKPSLSSFQEQRMRPSLFTVYIAQTSLEWPPTSLKPYSLLSLLDDRAYVSAGTSISMFLNSFPFRKSCAPVFCLPAASTCFRCDAIRDATAAKATISFSTHTLHDKLPEMFRSARAIAAHSSSSRSVHVSISVL